MNNGTVVYDLTDQTGDTFSNATGDVPVIGFAAWQRQFDAAANRNYGRIEAHSRIIGLGGPGPGPGPGGP